MLNLTILYVMMWPNDLARRFMADWHKFQTNMKCFGKSRHLTTGIKPDPSGDFGGFKKKVAYCILRCGCKIPSSVQMKISKINHQLRLEEVESNLEAGNYEDHDAGKQLNEVHTLLLPEKKNTKSIWCCSTGTSRSSRPLIGSTGVSYRWTGWLWEITGWSSRLQENYRSF